jgi:STE24 endopeptidase
MQIPAAAQWSTSFDVESATRAWLDTLSAAQRAHSNAYFEGGYWLLIWNLLWGLAIAALLLSGQRSARLRNWSERVSSHRGLQTLLYAAIYLLLTWLLSLPLSIYQHFFREHQYGLATQSFLPWFGERCISLALLIVIGSLFIGLLYWIVQCTGRVWWAWGGGLVTLYALIVIALAPVFIEPLFNDYLPLPAGPTRDSILSRARQRYRVRQRLCVQRFQAGHAHQRQRCRSARDHAHCAQQHQPARDPRRHGARDGALRAASHLAPRDLSRPAVDRHAAVAELWF